MTELVSVIPTALEIQNFAAAGTLAKQMSRRFGLMDQQEINLVGQVCLDLHRLGEIDLLAIPESVELKELPGTSFFGASRFLCPLLEQLDVPVSRMMNAIHALVERGAGDFFGSLPNGSFRIWCSADVTRAQAVVALAKSGNSKAISFLVFALEALADTDFAASVAREFDDSRRLAGIAAIGRMRHNDEASREEAISALTEILDLGVDEPARAAALEALLHLIGEGGKPVGRETVGLIRRICDAAGDETRFRVALALARYSGVLTRDAVIVLTSCLRDLNWEHGGTIELLDGAIPDLLRAGFDQEIIQLLEALASRPDEGFDLDCFSSFLRAVQEGPPIGLSYIVVRWLMDGNPLLCEGLSDALSGGDLAGRPLTLDGSHLALKPHELLFLCRKAVGYFFTKPVLAASILVSVLRCCDAETAVAVQAVLREPLLLNYQGIRDYLQGLPDDDPAKERVNKALRHNDDYLADIRAVPDPKEFQPSERDRQIERVRMSEEMSDLHREAMKKSPFLSMVSRSILLHGRGSLSFVGLPGEVPRAMEIDLKSMGVSFELPSTELVDPIGLNWMLRVFRRERIRA